MLSIIVPTYNEPILLRRCIQSVLDQSCPDWELLISPDDGKDYSFYTELDSRIKVISSDQVKSGPGPARNRALQYAQGSAIACLDDDDQLSKNYTEISLSALKEQDAILIPTDYIGLDGSLIRSIGVDSSALTISDFSYELGSLHAVAKKEIFPAWRNCFAQDVIHTCEIIDRLDCAIKIYPLARYYITIRSGSVCSSSLDIDDSYRALINLNIDTMSKKGQHEFSNLFKFRRAVNALYERENNGQNYNQFVDKLDANTKKKLFDSISSG